MKYFNYLYKSEYSVAILIAISVLSMSYPYGFPLFGLLSAFFVFLKLISGKFKIRINIGFWLFLACSIIYFSSLILSGGVIYSNNASDITNIISFFLIWVLLSDLERDKFHNLIENTSRITVLISLPTLVLSLSKFYNLLSGIYIDKYFIGDYYPTGTSLVRDYNMYSFAISFVIIMAIYRMTKATKNLSFIYYFTVLTLGFSCLVFAGSRRGWIVAAIILFILLAMLIKFILRINPVKLVKRSILISFLLLSFFSALKIFQVDLNVSDSYQFQKMMIRFETLQLSTSQDTFSERTDRWDYAGLLFNEYNIFQFLFGSGFGYLPQFANVFSPDLPEDYPHNPFLSSLLYSGIFGVLILITMFISAFAKLIRNRNVFGKHILMFYLISWLFILVSSNSIFSVSLFVIITLLFLAIPQSRKEKALVS